MEILGNLLDPLPEIHGQAAADTSCKDFTHWNVFLYSIPVNPDIPKFILYHYRLSGKQWKISI